MSDEFVEFVSKGGRVFNVEYLDPSIVCIFLDTGKVTRYYWSPFP